MVTTTGIVTINILNKIYNNNFRNTVCESSSKGKYIPPFATSPTPTCISWAMKPIMAKMTNPAKNEVKQLATETINESLEEKEKVWFVFLFNVYSARYLNILQVSSFDFLFTYTLSKMQRYNHLQEINFYDIVSIIT